MKQLIAFVKKEFRHVFRDKRNVLILLGMPVVQIILFGFAISTEIRNIDVVVCAPNMTEDIRRIAEAMDVSEYFTVKSIINDSRDSDRYFLDGSADMIVSFPSDFSENMFSPGGTDIQLMVDASNTNTARASVMYASGIIRESLSGGRQANMGISPNIRMLFNPQMKSSYGFVPGVMGLMISTRTETQVAAMLGSGMILMVPVMFFSGLLFPIESMPKIFQVISIIVPARWFIAGVKKIMIEGLPVAYIAKELIILSGMALLLIAVSLKNFNYRLK